MKEVGNEVEKKKKHKLDFFRSALFSRFNLDHVNI